MICTIKDLPRLRKKLLKKKTVFVSGCFDFLHEGHIQFLEKAATLGDVLIVGVLSDKYIRVRKKREPIQKQSHRAHIISSLKMVDHVVGTPYFESKYPSLEILKILRPRVFFRNEKVNMYKPIRKELKKLGIELSTLPMRKVNSTARTIKKIELGQ